MNDLSRNIHLFMDNIFAGKGQDEHTLYWASASPIPGFPQSEEKFFRTAARGKVNKACYFSTSTVVLDDEGKLYNRQKLFSRMYCVVLDDLGSGLGSKCKIEELPEVLQKEYSWRIETSPDNFQYGFLLDTPIDDLHDALSLIQILYGAGPWDSGGATSNKLVRLPCGINLKQKYANGDELFKIEPDNADELFTEEPFNTFTPDELLDAVRAGITWADIQAGNAEKLDPRRTQGTTPWREGVFHSNLEGVVDDALEWLNEQSLVVNEGDEWHDIICPWHKEHSDGGGNTAGYSPLGHGSKPERRAFHCFHDHCSDKHGTAFLQWVKDEGGPLVGIVDPVPLLVAEWALDEATNTFISLKDINIRIPNAGFKTGHQADVWWVGMNDKPAKASEYALILKSKGLLKLMGEKYFPGGPGIIEQGPYKKLNSWSIPQWETQKLDKSRDHWKMFTEFISYLMPDKQDAAWFLDHLAAKVQDPTYRGPCVTLTTPVQGSGRGTLENLLGDLWGPNNTATVGLSELIKGLSGEGFNDFLLNMWVVVPEAKDSQLTKAQESMSYESLKTGIDPAPTSHIIKKKYGGQGPGTAYSSTIICSNHEGKLNVPVSDRRFLDIRCTVRAATPEYFAEFNKWRESNWCPMVWNELKTRDISHHSGFAPKGLQRVQDPTDAIINVLPGQSPIDRIASVAVLFANTECGGLVHTPTVCHWASQFQIQLGIPSFSGWENVLKRVLQNSTSEIKPDGARRSYKIDGKKCFIRHTLNTEGYAVSDSLNETWDLELIKDSIHTKTAEDFRDFVLGIFNEAGL